MRSQSLPSSSCKELPVQEAPRSRPALARNAAGLHSVFHKAVHRRCGQRAGTRVLRGTAP
jgi:hypothetical protein